MTLTWMITVGVFMTTMLICLGVYTYLNSQEQIREWRRRADQSRSGAASALVAPWFGTMMPWLVRYLQRLGDFVKPSDAKEVASIRQALVTAGYRRRNAYLLFFGVKLLCAVAGVLVVSMIPVKVLGFPSFRTLLLLHTAAAFVGYYVPNLWLRLMISRRKQKILRALPDALDLLVTCVEAGLGLDMAIARVGDEIKATYPVFGQELHLLALELRTGLARQDALRNLAQRTDLEDIRTLVALLVQTDRFGTSIGQALRVHADAMRVTRQLRAEALAAKLPVKMLFPLVLFIFPSLFIVILGPAAIKIYRVIFPIMGAAGH